MVASILLLLLLACFLPNSYSSSEVEINSGAKVGNRFAMVVTLAGPNKLSEYFEWTCRTIVHSADSFDMLVFHEGNSRLQSIVCAHNVKFIDLGKNGLSKLIVSELLSEFNTSSEANRGSLTDMLSDVITHIPRYLIEVKPMTGSLFRDYLTPYSHWTYTDPDIVWGNIGSWILPDDARTYDIITLAKTFDAGRLFVRGQFALHKNAERTNKLWKGLTYFSPHNFATRVVNAVHMLRDKKTTDTIFQSCFHSAEGYYSELVLKSGVAVKIIGRGFDDFNMDPVILKPDGLLVRSKAGVLLKTLQDLTSDAVIEAETSTALTLPPIVVKKANAYHDKSACYMQWLPTSLRYCLAVHVYDKDAALVNHAESKKLRLERLGESFTLDGVTWQANDEKKASRQLANGAAFFHFRHWDDFGSTGLETKWAANSDGNSKSCMVTYVREDKVLAFESCGSVIARLSSSEGGGEGSVLKAEGGKKKADNSSTHGRRGKGGKGKGSKSAKGKRLRGKSS